MTDPDKPSKARQTSTRVGLVASTGGDKTIRVIVNHMVKHPLYGKYLRRRTRLAVHDPLNDARTGDVVEIVPCRPISKAKSWRLLRIVRRSALAEAAEKEA